MLFFLVSNTVNFAPTFLFIYFSEVSSEDKLLSKPPYKEKGFISVSDFTKKKINSFKSDKRAGYK